MKSFSGKGLAKPEVKGILFVLCLAFVLAFEPYVRKFKKALGEGWKIFLKSS